MKRNEYFLPRLINKQNVKITVEKNGNEKFCLKNCRKKLMKFGIYKLAKNISEARVSGSDELPDNKHEKEFFQ